MGSKDTFQYPTFWEKGESKWIPNSVPLLSSRALNDTTRPDGLTDGTALNFLV